MSNEKDPNKNKEDVIISTEPYDGIIEHDHPLPNWWVTIFILTIIFSVFYYGYYEIFDGPSTDQELAAKMELIQSSVADASARGGDFSDLDERVKDLSLIPLGKEVYAGKCFMCHGDKGQGLIGPNLADNFWIHGNTPAEILYVIQKGVPEKGMVPWESVLSAEEQIATVAFILSLKGTNPPGGKPPEGVEYKD